MKKILFVLFCCSCTAAFPPAENDLDAGREFLDGCLKGNFDKAAFYMLPGAENTKALHTIENNYHKKNKDEKSAYAAASIIIDDTEMLNDSVHLIYYKNSVDKIAHKLKVVLTANKWQVDIQYTFDGNL